MSEGVDMALEKEIETYRSKLPEMKEHEGKFVLIYGDQIVDYFSTYEDAVKGGYHKFKLDPFLVQRVQTIEQVHFISRLLDPCHI